MIHADLRRLNAIEAYLVPIAKQESWVGVPRWLYRLLYWFVKTASHHCLPQKPSDKEFTFLRNSKLSVIVGLWFWMLSVMEWEEDRPNWRPSRKYWECTGKLSHPIKQPWCSKEIRRDKQPSIIQSSKFKDRFGRLIHSCNIRRRNDYQQSIRLCPKTAYSGNIWGTFNRIQRRDQDRIEISRGISESAGSKQCHPLSPFQPFVGPIGHAVIGSTAVESSQNCIRSSFQYH